MSNFEVDPGRLEYAGATLTDIASVLGSQEISAASRTTTGNDDLADALSDCVRRWAEAWALQRTRLGSHAATVVAAAAEYRSADAHVAEALPEDDRRSGAR